MAKYFSIKPSASAERSNFYVVESIQSIEAAHRYTLITLLSGKQLQVIELSNQVIEMLLNLEENGIVDFIEYIGEGIPDDVLSSF